MTYEASIVRETGAVIDGEMRLKAKVVMVRYEEASGPPIKVATRTVRAWTSKGLDRAAEAEAEAIMLRDKKHRTEEIHRQIDRIKVSLIKEKK